MMRLVTLLLTLPLAALCQDATPVPADSLELLTGPIQSLTSPEGQQSALDLLAAARRQYLITGAGQAYDLKVTFKVNSGGQTRFDGDWEMEEIYAPRLGKHWTAKSSAGYSTTQIIANGLNFGEGTENTIPLRLHEARATLLDPLATNPNRDRLRSATATYNGASLTCILHSSTEAVPTLSGRRWDEVEDCIDPQTSLLTLHSTVPGRYYTYDYSDAPRIGNRMLPRKVTVSEAGKIVSEIHVESLTPTSAADRSLFAPTKDMNWSPVMSGQRHMVSSQMGAHAKDALIQPVCIFGLVNATGELVEAHSMQPSDPNSQAALDRAKSLSYSIPAAPNAGREQHFVFVIVKFPAPAKGN